MKKRFIDPSTNRKNEIVKEKLFFYNNIPLFSIIEFNLYGNCNRNCSFCPVSDPLVYEKKHEGITVALFEKTINDLVAINYQGKILFSAYSEPLLHKEIHTLISIAKQKLPLSRVEIVSNGDLLTPTKLKQLFDAGLDTISISMYDGDHQIEHFNTMTEAIGLDATQVVLRRRYYKDGNYGITISNRSGLVNSNEYRDQNESEINTLPLHEKCYYPFYMILIDYTGDVMLCPHDWSRKLSFGNVQEKSIVEIWEGKALNAIRSKLSNNNRNFFPCSKCDVLGTLMGEDSFDAWGNTGLIAK